MSENVIPASHHLVTAVAALVLTIWEPASWADPAVDVGRSHVAFAKSLTADRVHFGPEDLSWLDAYGDACELWGLKDYQAHEQIPPPEGDLRKRVLQNYLNLYCKPWGKLWFTNAGACNHKPVPTWCDQEDGLYKHLNLDAYFDTLTGAMKTSHLALERYNLMAIMLNAIGAHVATEWPEDSLEKWYALATREFLRSATVGEAEALVKQFQDTEVGLMPAVVNEFKSYAESAAGLSVEKKEQLLRSLDRRFSDSS